MVKELRAANGLGLEEAKLLLTGLPSTVVESVPREGGAARAPAGESGRRGRAGLVRRARRGAAGGGPGAHNCRVDLLAAIRERDRQALGALVADDVVFNSPVRSYRGRDQVVDLLALIGGVLDDLTATREVETVTFVKGHVDGEELDGVLVAIRGADDRISEITLLLRPLATLRAAVRKMARALAEGGQPGE